MNWVNYNFGQIVPYCLWAQALLVILSCLTVIVLYARAKDDRLWNIVGVAIAHSILTVRGVTGLVEQVYPLNSFWGVAVCIAFVLTDYHLISLVLRRYPNLWASGKKENND